MLHNYGDNYKHVILRQFLSIPPGRREIQAKLVPGLIQRPLTTLVTPNQILFSRQTQGVSCCCWFQLPTHQMHFCGANKPLLPIKSCLDQRYAGRIQASPKRFDMMLTVGKNIKPNDRVCIRERYASARAYRSQRTPLVSIVHHKTLKFEIRVGLHKLSLLRLIARVFSRLPLAW